MATYIIGDIHGCFDELQLLLTQFSYNSKNDKLWFIGDLVNGGGKSLETLQFVKNLDNTICVLGNHDLTLLGVARGQITPLNDRDIGFGSILIYKHKEELLSWLINRPLIHYDPDFNVLLVHAGIAPQWTLEKSLALGKEVEAVLKGHESTQFFANMFGNKPSIWNDNLTGWDRIRCIVNYMTRMRFCYADGNLNFNEKGPINPNNSDIIPWFNMPNRLTLGVKIIFGHWAALKGITNCKNATSLDTGCIWGGSLSAIRLEDNKLFRVNKIKYK